MQARLYSIPGRVGRLLAAAAVLTRDQPATAAHGTTSFMKTTLGTARRLPVDVRQRSRALAGDGPTVPGSHAAGWHSCYSARCQPRGSTFPIGAFPVGQ